MPEFEEEYRKYKEREFPDEIAAAKALAHSLAPSTPGVWRVILQVVSEAESVRENIVAWTPDGFEGEVKELLACTRTIREMREGRLHCGWFWVEYGGCNWYVVHSANSSLPYTVGEEDIIDGGRTFRFKVAEDIPTILRSNANEEADYEWIGLFFWGSAWLLEVRRSERGLRAIEDFERSIEEQWQEVIEVLGDE